MLINIYFSGSDKSIKLIEFGAFEVYFNEKEEGDSVLFRIVQGMD